MKNSTQYILDNVKSIGFKITNNTDKIQTIRLFDVDTKYNDNTEVNIDVINKIDAQVTKLYDEYIADKNLETTKLGSIYVNSDNTNQVSQILSIINKAAESVIPIVTQIYFTADQTDSKYVFINHHIDKTKDTVISFDILPNTVMAIRFYDDVEEIEESKEEISIGITKKDEEVEVPKKIIVESSDLNDSISTIKQKYTFSSTPYQLDIINKTDEPKIANLFGFNKNYDKRDSNFSSEEGIEIHPSQYNVSYSELLAQTALQPFKTSLIRIYAKTEEQVKQIITIKCVDANGQTVTIPLITESYWSENQPQKNIIDIPYCYNQDANTELFIKILPKERVVITLFPDEKINTSRLLRGNYFENITNNISILKEKNKDFELRLSILENKKSWFKKLFSKTK